jgi:DNA transformation protein
MAVDSEFALFVEDQLAPLGGVSGARMFGGYGLRHEGMFFALIFDERLFVRSDENLRAELEALGSEAFSYETKRGPVQVQSYYEVPSDLLDSQDELLEVARKAIAAARLAAARKAKKSRTKKSKPDGKKRGKT